MTTIDPFSTDSTLPTLHITPFQLAQRFVGITEAPGSRDNDQILAMLRLDADWPDHDEVPWCSAFVNYVAWLLRLPRSKSLRARSWLEVGLPVALHHASVGFDVVILSRGSGSQPGPSVINAPGHVGFFAGWDGHNENRNARIHLLGGNQSNSVSLSTYDADRILGIRRLIG